MEISKRGGDVRVLALDPGTAITAWLVYDSRPPHDDIGRPVAYGMTANGLLLEALRERCQISNDQNPGPGPNSNRPPPHRFDLMVFEEMKSFGLPVGREVFTTIEWYGRFIEAFAGGDTTNVHRVTRHDVKMHLCGSVRAKDPNVRQALIDRFGATKQEAIGTKGEPGPLHGISKDVWSALGVAVTFCETWRPEFATRLNSHSAGGPEGQSCDT